MLPLEVQMVGCSKSERESFYSGRHVVYLG